MTAQLEANNLVIHCAQLLKLVESALNPKYLFRLNNSLNLFKTLCAFLPPFSPNLDFLQALKVIKIWPSSVPRPSK